MFSVISKFTSSLMGLARESGSSNVDTENRVNEIRQAMLDCIFDCLPHTAAPPAILQKIQFATAIQTLWYLRVDLMALLSEHGSETLAKAKIAAITDMFRGLLPNAAKPTRPRR
jgi:hypothetical protein